MSAVSVSLDIYAADLDAPKLRKQYGDRWAIHLADHVTLWATREELTDLVSRLMDVAAEMGEPS